MSNVNPLNGPTPTYRPTYAKPAAPKPVGETYSPNNVDRLELSNVDHLLSQLKTNDVRLDKVNAIKAQIADGTYETDDKLTAAADKLLDDVL